MRRFSVKKDEAADIPALELWRRVPRPVFTKYIGRVIVLLAEVTPREALGDDLPTLMVQQSEEAAIRIAMTVAARDRHMLNAAHSDVAWSWCAVAAAFGSAVAVGALVEKILGQACAEEGADRAKLFDVAASWSETNGPPNVIVRASSTLTELITAFRPETDHASSIRRGLLKDLRNQIDRTIASIQTAQEAIRSPPPKPAEPARSTDSMSVVVLPRGIAGTDAGTGRELAKAYGVLTKPLPLITSKIAVDLLRTVLDLEFPWMHEVTETICRSMNMRIAAGHLAFRIPPILLVGPPGAGKSFYAARFAKLVGVPIARQSGAGSDNRSLEGTARGWSSVTPCAPAIAMAVNGIANPMMVIDEIDKHTPSRNGSIWSTLLTMLDDTKSEWPDEALMSPLDLSHLSWILTANRADKLPAPLLSRLKVITVGGPRVEHFDSVFPSVVRSVVTELVGDATDLPEFDVQTIAGLKRLFRVSKGDVRRLRRAVEVVLSINTERIVH